MTLYEAATGREPFESDGETGHYEQLRRKADPLAAHTRLPRAFSGPVDACLDPEPSRRPTVAELAAAFHDLIAG